jgi:glycosyltransferase involved in cell wall biosynthesis
MNTGISTASRNLFPTLTIRVVIPACNEEARIAATIEALQKSTRPPDQIVVAVNGSRDRTAEIARSCGALVVENAEALGPGIARNVGASAFPEIRHDILFMVDADTLVAPHLIEEACRALTNGYVGGTCDMRPLEPGWKGRLFWAYHNPYCRRFYHLTGVFFCWRSPFLHVGGFDAGKECVQGEDNRLYAKIRAHGQVLRLRSAWATTSMRRFEREGYWRVTWRWFRSDWWPWTIRPTDFQEVRP